MTEFHINSDHEPPAETVELLAKAAEQIERSVRREREYRWWRFWTNLREYPPDKLSVATLVLMIVLTAWGLWTGDLRLW